MLCNPCSLLSPQHRWKASLGAPQGSEETPLSDRNLTPGTQDPRHPGILSDCWMPSENRLGEGGEVKIEPIPQDN